MAVINLSPRTQTEAAAVCVYVCVHVCDELHYTSPIGLSQGPRHSSVHRHKARC